MKSAVPVAVVIATIAVGSAASKAQQPTFGRAVEAVRVDALITENGTTVRGLRADDFEVTDNGVMQQVDLVAFDLLPTNVILALDLSESTKGERMVHLRIGARAVLAALAGGDRAALVTFNDHIQLRHPLTPDVAAVRAAFDEMKPAGGTALVDGTYAALMLAGSDAGRDLVVVFSDGLDTDSILTAERVLEAASRTDAVVYGVTAGSSGRVGFLKTLSDQTGGQSLEIASSTDLQKSFVAILDEFRQRYVLSFTPRGVSSTGFHKLQVRVKGRRPTITARQGYTAGS